jgi:uncharacterized membrane protein YdcZ (DUF606 family)
VVHSPGAVKYKLNQIMKTHLYILASLPHFHRLPHHITLWILLAGLAGFSVLVLSLWLMRRLSRLR